jgi:hypothetical protein
LLLVGQTGFEPGRIFIAKALTETHVATRDDQLLVLAKELRARFDERLRPAGPIIDDVIEIVPRALPSADAEEA